MSADIDRNAQWQAGNAAIAGITKDEFGSYLRGLPNRDRAFKLDDLVLRCIDGRTPGGLHLAGSGILLGIKGALQFNAEVERLRHVWLEAIGWHRDCGAAAIYAKKHGGTADDCAWRFAEELAGRLGVEAIEVDSTPLGFHPERAIYYDGTGRFNWAKVPGLLTGFTVSRAYLDFDVEYARRELAMALGIALTSHTKGGHGFGEMFTEHEPLLVIVVANDYRELKKLKAEAQDVIDALPTADQSRVRLDSFTRPQ